MAPQHAALDDPAFVDAHSEYLERTAHVSWDGGVTGAARRAVELAGGDVVAEVLALHRLVGTTMRYVPGSTYVGVDIEDVLARGEGVCQDFAHLAVALCRSVGIPARYVSGYFFTVDDATGADTDDNVVHVQTHAWFEAAVPRFGWLALDPTNQQAVGLRHVKIGHGRDYDDVQPLRGVFAGGAHNDVEVNVEIRRMSVGAARPDSRLERRRRSRPMGHASVADDDLGQQQQAQQQ
ncbi:MAG: transglutaminase-like domain-containing protein, partial [Acidimicrobiales bacterium]